MNVQGTLLKITVNGINSHQTIDTKIVELKLTPVFSGGSCPASLIRLYVRRDLIADTEITDVDTLQVLYLNLEPIPLKKNNYGDVKMILGQDLFHFIHPLEYFATDRKLFWNPSVYR